MAADNDSLQPETEPAETAETEALSDRHAFDAAAVEAYCLAQLEEFAAPLAIRQFAGGNSNPTFLLTDAQGHRYVLRKKPPGEVLPTAHQVEREYRVMAGLAATAAPVPRVRCLCEDPSLIGTNFYIMDYVPGRIFRDAKLPGMPKAERAAIYDGLNAALACLHKVDYVAAGLESFGKPGNYFERQIARWIRQYRAAETEEIPDMERLIDWLPANLPEDSRTSIAHGDYRLENVMFHPSEPRVVAILDWELSTIGHPIADLAYNCLMYHTDSEAFGSLLGVDFAASGIPTKQAYVEAYCRRMGFEEDLDLRFYLAFAQFRLASIAQGREKRRREGLTHRLPPPGNSCADQAARAWRIVTQPDGA